LTTLLHTGGVMYTGVLSYLFYPPINPPTIFSLYQTEN